MSKEKQEKQAFLKEQILDGGYDHNAFTDFLKQKKRMTNLAGGDDLDLWNFDELRAV